MSEKPTPQNPASGSEKPEDPEPEAPLNRAARRSKGKTQPGHVGPQNDPTRAGRGPRPHTKRSL